MTEAEWLASADVGRMIEALDTLPGDRHLWGRKALHLVAACVRRAVPNADARVSLVVTTIERVADQEALSDEVAEVLAETRRMDYVQRCLWRATDRLIDHTLRESESVPLALSFVGEMAQFAENPGETATFADILREIVGNPYRPVAFDPAWRTANVLALAQTAYGDRAFAALPILADALADTGCDDADLLGHLRGPGPHVRGCWALDLVLGREAAHERRVGPVGCDRGPSE